MVTLPKYYVELKTAIQLIEKGITEEDQQTWFDLGCGDGLFSKALASSLTGQSVVVAIDKNKEALTTLDGSIGSVRIMTQLLDFVHDSLQGQADGILMANSLHFVKDKTKLLKALAESLVPGGRFIVVEYDISVPSPWVPYPVSFQKLVSIAQKCGWPGPDKLEEVPSVYSGRKMYSAVLRPD